ncbi:MAG: ATP-binding protein [Bacteroidia bacterium]
MKINISKLLFICLIALRIPSYGQSTKFAELHEQFLEAIENNDTSARRLLLQAAQELEDGYSLGIGPGQIFFYQGYDYYNSGDYANSLKCFFAAEKNFIYIKDSCKLKDALFNIGNVISIMGDNRTAIKYFTESSKITSCKKVSTSTMLYHYNLGLLFSAIDKHEDARNQFQIAVDSKIESPQDTLNLYLSILALNFEDSKLGQNDEAISSHLKVLKDSFIYRFPMDLLYYAYSDLGKFYIEKNNADSAEYYFLKSRAIPKTEYVEEYQLMDMLNCASLHNEKKEYKKSIMYGTKALERSRLLGNIERQKKALQFLIVSYEEQEKWQEAYKYTTKLHQITDSLEAEQTKMEYLVNEIEQNHEELASLENAVVHKTKTVDQLSNWIAWLAILSLIIALVSFILYKSKKKQDLLNKKLSLSNKNKEKILRTLTHDIRTPLIDINNVLDLFEMDALSPTDKNKIVLTIRKKVDHLMDNVDSILQWSISQIKGANAVKRTTTTLELVESAIEFVKNQATAKNINIILEDFPNDISVEVDKSQIVIVLRNILGNAIKFSKPGGQILLFSRKTKSSASIDIQDFGKGISEQNIKKILDNSPFTLDSSNSGTGVGLKLAKEYLALNNGVLSIESTPKIGSTFTVELR